MNGSSPKFIEPVSTPARSGPAPSPVIRSAIGIQTAPPVETIVIIDDSELAAEALPHRHKYLLLVNNFLRRLLDLHIELVDEVERELAPADRS